MIVRLGMLIAVCVTLGACSQPEPVEPVMEDEVMESGKL